ncbi:TetR/AcrR family transcriptional regulator [Hyphomicrobium facile]|uniref:Transcriptional regulator, TetR family n=1 Tax=Hyphomicrobium facile TaxID=51670 RepID=A0A1I7NR10_9HYPH|nr:TetR/AcrR family transcriptional regulator [Hyphomicrobium facile]SFV37127.1 transcriptional regulator, TetR family [Hyphomicrobium facile]
MPRVSRKQADQHRKDVLDAASRLFLEHGIDGVSVPDVMAEAGLTHGGFYGHFSSKEALVAEACAKAFEDRRSTYEGFIERNGSDRKAARAEFIKRYASKNHRDSVGLGCPAAAMCGDLARKNPRGPVRAAFATAMDTLVDRLAPVLSGKKKAATREETLAQLSMLVGGLVLARSTKGHPISDEILQSVRSALIDE